jgi:hypothetical protein
MKVSLIWLLPQMTAHFFSFLEIGTKDRIKSSWNLLNEFIYLSIYSDDLILFSDCTLSVALGSLTCTIRWDSLCVMH